MFIFNVKLSGNKLFKTFISISIIFVLLILLFICFKIFSEIKKQKNNYEPSVPSTINITAENYANILKAVHENLDSYIDKEIHFTGYVYRAIDFKPEEFVLARDMIMNYSSTVETLIVGFLCNSNKAINLPDNTWVEITGIIKKGIYHSEVPIVYITELKQIEKPSNEFVNPPDDTYIPTSSIM